MCGPVAQFLYTSGSVIISCKFASTPRAHGPRSEVIEAKGVGCLFAWGVFILLTQVCVNGSNHNGGTPGPEYGPDNPDLPWPDEQRRLLG